MEKVKEFFASPKKTAILGLIGATILLIYNMYIYMVVIRRGIILFDFFLGLLASISYLGLTIYFAIVLMRMHKKGGNIKVANYMLIASMIIQIVLWCISVLSALEYLRYDLAYMISQLVNMGFYVISLLYYINIFLKKDTFINNIIYVITVLVYFIYCISRGFSVLSLVLSICYLTRIPYFYNYYNLLNKKEEK